MYDDTRYHWVTFDEAEEAISERETAAAELASELRSRPDFLDDLRKEVLRELREEEEKEGQGAAAQGKGEAAVQGVAA